MIQVKVCATDQCMIQVKVCATVRWAPIRIRGACFKWRHGSSQGVPYHTYWGMIQVKVWELTNA